MTQQESTRHTTVLDDTDRQVAQVYAEALYNTAEKQQEAPAVLEDLQTLVNQVFAKDPAIESFLFSAVFNKDRKQEVLDRAFDGTTRTVFANFLQVLNEHNRLNLIRAIAEAYENIHNLRMGRMPVDVLSAVPLSDDQQEKLREELRTAFGRDPILQTRVDPDLLGGLIVRVGDWVYDGSVRSRLRNIREQLIQRSGHEYQSRRDRFRS